MQAGRIEELGSTQSIEAKRRAVERVTRGFVRIVLRGVLVRLLVGGVAGVTACTARVPEAQPRIHWDLTQLCHRQLPLMLL